jgi:hypothetical protein
MTFYLKISAFIIFLSLMIVIIVGLNNFYNIFLTDIQYSIKTKRK